MSGAAPLDAPAPTAAQEPAGAVIVMLSRGLGGIEQAALDQADMLRRRGFPTLIAVSRGAPIAPLARAAGHHVAELRQAGAYDLLAAWKLRRIVDEFGASIVLCHGARGLQLLYLARPKSARLVAMGHNYKAQVWRRADAAIVVSEDIKRHAVRHGLAAARVYVIPNAAEVPHERPPRSPLRTPPAIGGLGRFVKKKGFHVLLDALAILKRRNLAFRAVIGGDGEEGPALAAQAKRLGLGDRVSFPGWVRDKAAFFADIDIFCISSLHEPFGIVILEAFAAGVPLVATRSEGPSAIVSPGETGLLVPKNDAEALADAIAEMVARPESASARAEAAFEAVRSMYAKPAVAARLTATLQSILSP